MTYNSVFKEDLFKDQTIIVTGGGSGIGRCTAHELAALGANVVLLGRSEDKLIRVQAEITEDGGKACWYSQDIRDEAGVAGTIAKILEEQGQVHGLVNNAGGQFPSALKDISGNGFDAVVKNNLHGGFFMARELYTQCMEEHGGAIVSIVADMWGGMPNMGHSGAARAGMVNLTQTMAVEWASSGVRANAVAPGWIASSGLDTYTNPLITKLIPKMKRLVPLQRLAVEAEVSAAMCFLLSPAAAFITGQCINIDGGSPLNSRGYPHAPHENSTAFDGFHRAVKPKSVDREFNEDDS